MTLIGIPCFFTVLEWLLDQQETDQIEAVNSNTLRNLIETSPSLAVLFHDSSSTSTKVLGELENIDDDADRLVLY